MLTDIELAAERHNFSLDSALSNDFSYFYYFFSACNRNFVKSLKAKIPEIPPFRGHVPNSIYNKVVGTIKKSATG